MEFVSIILKRKFFGNLRYLNGKKTVFPNNTTQWIVEFQDKL